MVDYIITMRDGGVIRGRTSSRAWSAFSQSVVEGPWAYLSNDENESAYVICTCRISYLWSIPVPA